MVGVPLLSKAVTTIRTVKKRKSLGVLIGLFFENENGPVVIRVTGRVAECGGGAALHVSNRAGYKTTAGARIKPAHGELAFGTSHIEGCRTATGEIDDVNFAGLG